MVVPAAYVTQEQLAEAVERAIPSLGPEVVRIRYNMGLDTVGDLALFFRVVLADWAASRETVLKVSREVERTLLSQIRPYENWGLFPHFSYRSSSENSPEPEWN